MPHAVGGGKHRRRHERHEPGVSRTARRAREVSVETAARAVPRIARAWRADGFERAFTAAVGATGAPPRVDWGTAEAPPLLVAFSVGFGSGA